MVRRGDAAHVRRWMALAEERLAGNDAKCFVMPGNDDPPGVDRAIEDAPGWRRATSASSTSPATRCLARLLNRTPFDSPRELEEDELYRRVERVAEQVEDLRAACSTCTCRPTLRTSIPPRSSTRTSRWCWRRAAEDGAGGLHRGPRADRALPAAVSLHGHVHESRGATRIGRTLAINPGSDYHTGRISGCSCTSWATGPTTSSWSVRR